jgi:carbon monoxide dehydrogenase subunit G
LDFKDQRIIEASSQKVWEHLLDPGTLKECVPGCEIFTGNISDGFETTVVQKIGPVKAKFKGTIYLSELDEHKGLRITGKGDGGIAGFVKGGADVTLEAHENATKLNYNVQAQIGGKLAQLGSRVLDSFVDQMADQFFEKFQEKVEKNKIDSTKSTQIQIGYWKKFLRFLNGKARV